MKPGRPAIPQRAHQTATGTAQPNPGHGWMGRPNRTIRPTDRQRRGMGRPYGIPLASPAVWAEKKFPRSSWESGKKSAGSHRRLFLNFIPWTFGKTTQSRSSIQPPLRPSRLGGETNFPSPVTRTRLFLQA
ncbi:MAG: hypothetical protein R6V73_09080 [Anaerolineales bacterium]